MTEYDPLGSRDHNKRAVDALRHRLVPQRSSALRTVANKLGCHFPRVFTLIGVGSLHKRAYTLASRGATQFAD